MTLQRKVKEMLRIKADFRRRKINTMQFLVPDREKPKMEKFK